MSSADGSGLQITARHPHHPHQRQMVAHQEHRCRPSRNTAGDARVKERKPHSLLDAQRSTVPLLPFDRNDPPRQPPESCDNALMWGIAYQLFCDHRPDGDGFCITCVPSKFIPCVGRDLALRGFLASLGRAELSISRPTTEDER
jgi:hypothetical protein